MHYSAYRSISNSYVPLKEKKWRNLCRTAESDAKNLFFLKEPLILENAKQNLSNRVNSQNIFM